MLNAKLGATESPTLGFLATFGEEAKEPRADAIRSRGGKATHPLKMAEAQGRFTKSGQEPTLFATVQNTRAIIGY